MVAATMSLVTAPTYDWRMGPDRMFESAERGRNYGWNPLEGWR